VKRERHLRRRGFFLADTVMGFIVVGILGVILVTAITKSSRARDRLEESATADRIAQRVMGVLREGKPGPATLGDAQVKVKAASGGAVVAGQRWVEVSVVYHGRSASLVGLVPAGGAP
jgi:hypothetical protein